MPIRWSPLFVVAATLVAGFGHAQPETGPPGARTVCLSNRTGFYQGADRAFRHRAWTLRAVVFSRTLAVDDTRCRLLSWE